MNEAATGQYTTVSKRELPFACPPPNAPRWRLHPRVFLPLSESRPEAACPYCGTHYRLAVDDSD